MQSTKVLAVTIVLMLGLLTTGLAYGHWNQIISLSGSVATGGLDWEIHNYKVAADGIQGEADWHCNDGFVGSPSFWQGTKDVGITTMGRTDPHTVTVTLTNVYPSYFTSISVYPHNTGTMPLKIDRAILSSAYDTDTLRAIGYVELDLDGDGKDDIEFSYGNHFGFQMEPCALPDPEISFWAHVLQDAPQGETLSFTIEIVAVQYDQYVPPVP